MLRLVLGSPAGGLGIYGSVGQRLGASISALKMSATRGLRQECSDYDHYSRGLSSSSTDKLPGVSLLFPWVRTLLQKVYPMGGAVGPERFAIRSFFDGHAD